MKGCDTPGCGHAEESHASYVEKDEKTGQYVQKRRHCLVQFCVCEGYEKRKKVGT